MSIGNLSGDGAKWIERKPNRIIMRNIWKGSMQNQSGYSWEKYKHKEYSKPSQIGHVSLIEAQVSFSQSNNFANLKTVEKGYF